MYAFCCCLFVCFRQTHHTIIYLLILDMCNNSSKSKPTIMRKSEIFPLPWIVKWCLMRFFLSSLFWKNVFSGCANYRFDQHTESNNKWEGKFK